MQKPKMLLHVGTHKTGTTAIQAALAQNRQQLLESGIHYPSLRPEFGKEAEGHHKVAHAVARYGLQDKASLFLFARRIANASKKIDLTVLSAEPIYRRTLGLVRPEDSDIWFEAHEAYLRRIREVFEKFDIKVLCYFRHPEKMAISLYKENITKGNFRGNMAGFLISRKHVFDYARHLSALKSIFGDVDIRNFEQEVKTGLIAGFVPQCGIHELAGLNKKQVRTSPSNRAAMWLRNIPKTLTKTDGRRRALFALRESGSEYFAEQNPSVLWSGEEQQIEFANLYRQSYAPPFPFKPIISKLQTTVWTPKMQDAADAGFAEWESANLALLQVREAAHLQLFAPDPATF